MISVKPRGRGCRAHGMRNFFYERWRLDTIAMASKVTWAISGKTINRQKAGQWGKECGEYP
jgi:hypothetical protein